MRFVAGLAIAVMAGDSLSAAPLLHSAEARIEMRADGSCAVALTLAIDGPAPVEHRLSVIEGTRAHLLGVDDAGVEAGPRAQGRTLSLVLRPEAPRYTLRYTVDQPTGWGARCPLWVPTRATDGRSREVRIHVVIPAGATAGSTLPALRWTGTEGVALLGHLPAFVHVPVSEPGATPALSIASLMDLLAVATLVLATLAWVTRRRLAQ
jgi:hypothetical protein